ncbi:hypothetical protein HYPSUDRAFT_216455 [Hypholoma sublateritium FD-334 SS-4]|uniref:DUF2461 domain-containing protein n=1 Tax=Hypholoma sublateritium (strain FD-334 SS-4) TaxID=945553 RepID=A0A0D2NRG5_HYPSF|nr:hypothetical protein HYPSUDRAFT_216455 [Hypholoma sublateritium FD-334 SS-4]
MAPAKSSKNATKKSPTKKAKFSRKASPKSDSDASKQPAAASHVDSEIDSDALDDDSDIATKKRKTRKATTQSPRKKRKTEDDEEYDEEDVAPSPAQLYDSDALDDDFDEPPTITKRKARVSTTKNNKQSKSPRKKKRQEASDVEYADDLEEGQEVVGVVVQAPKTGRVPPGQISKNTLDFLSKLGDPACNDRDWFKLHEPVYRVAEKEWKDFVEAFTDVLVDVDSQIPHLPPKDLIHRIYRDVRFSNDKTPYKRNMSASFSRSGRKGIFAGFKPGNESMIAAGTWCPGRNELATIRTNIQRSSRRLRRVISAPDFVKFFGKAERHPMGERQNVFGNDDELKVAPKGIAKDDKDIDLLKCRSFAVSHRFSDSEVLAPDFKDAIAVVAKVMQPFVHCLNDMMTVNNDDESDDDDDQEGEDDEDDEEA